MATKPVERCSVSLATRDTNQNGNEVPPLACSAGRGGILGEQNRK